MPRFTEAGFERAATGKLADIVVVDTGSASLEHAPIYDIYAHLVYATAEARAQRRHTDDLAKGFNSGPLAVTQAEIEARDQRDKTRADSPLMQAADAIYLDSSGLTITEVVERILGIVATV